MLFRLLPRQFIRSMPFEMRRFLSDFGSGSV
jgi:hypothetical protein